jgi:hypothetical protein
VVPDFPIGLSAHIWIGGRLRFDIARMFRDYPTQQTSSGLSRAEVV